MVEVLTRQELDRMVIEGCAICATEGRECNGHEGLFLAGRCDPGAGAWVEYKDGLLLLLCPICESEIVKVKVALDPP